MHVRDAMSRDFTVIDPQTTLQKAAQLMREHDCGYLPVGENDRLKGAVTDRNIVVRALADGLPTDTPVSRVYSDNIAYCYDDADIHETTGLMEERQVRRLVVLNRTKRLVGILSLGDIARASNDHRLTGKTEIGVAQPA